MNRKHSLKVAILLLSIPFLSASPPAIRVFAAQSSPGVARGRETPLKAILRQAQQARAAGHLVNAERLYQNALKTAEQTGEHGPRIANILLALAELHSQEGETAQALAAMQRALTLNESSLPSEQPEVAGNLSTLALFYDGQKNAPEAENCHRKALAVAEQLPPDDRGMRLLVLNNAAAFYRRQNNYAEAEKLLRHGLEIAEASPVQNQSEVRNLRASLASLYRLEGKTADAETLLADAVPADGAASANGPHADLSGMLGELELAREYKDQGKLDEAEARYQNVISTLEKAARPDELGMMASALDGLGVVFEAEGRDADAEEAYLRSIRMQEKAVPSLLSQGKVERIVGTNLARVLGYHFGLLNLYRKEGRLNEMEPILQHAISVQEAALGPNDKVVGETLAGLARVYVEEHNYDDALPAYSRALEIQEYNLKPYDLRLAFSLDEYADILKQAGRDQEAASMRARAQRIRELNPGGNSKP